MNRSAFHFVHGLRDGQRYGACLWSSCGMCVLREAIFNDHDVTNFLLRESILIYIVVAYSLHSCIEGSVFPFRPSLLLSIVYGHFIRISFTKQILLGL